MKNYTRQTLDKSGTGLYPLAMLIPGVVFRYSWIYDDLYRQRCRRHKMPYPRTERVKAYVPRAERAWRRVERRALRLLTEIS